MNLVVTTRMYNQKLSLKERKKQYSEMSEVLGNMIQNFPPQKNLKVMKEQVTIFMNALTWNFVGYCLYPRSMHSAYHINCITCNLLTPQTGAYV